MKDRVIHELLRDLVGTAKANGNTDVIITAIEHRVAAYENAIDQAFTMLSEIEKRLGKENGNG